MNGDSFRSLTIMVLMVVFAAVTATGWFLHWPISHWFYTLHKQTAIHFWISSTKVSSKCRAFSSDRGWVSLIAFPLLLNAQCTCSPNYSLSLGNTLLEFCGRCQLQLTRLIIIDWTFFIFWFIRMQITVSIWATITSTLHIGHANEHAYTISYKNNTANTIGRRWTNVISFLLSAVFCVPAIFLVNRKFYGMQKSFAKFSFSVYASEVNVIYS